MSSSVRCAGSLRRVFGVAMPRVGSAASRRRSARKRKSPRTAASLRALEFTADLARHKVENEMRLVQGQTIDETTRKPSVHYRLLEEHPDGAEAVRYLYHGSIAIEDADRLERRWLVTVRLAGGSWRVTNYEEFEG